MIAVLCLLAPSILWALVRQKVLIYKESTDKGTPDRVFLFVAAVVVLNGLIQFLLNSFLGYEFTFPTLFESLNSGLVFPVKYLLLSIFLCSVAFFIEFLWIKGWIRSTIRMMITVEVIILIYLGGRWILDSHTAAPLDKYVSGEMISSGDNYFTLPEERTDHGQNATVLEYDYGGLPAGFYRGDVKYQADESQGIFFMCSEVKYLKAEKIILDKGQDKTTFYVTITQPVDRFRIMFDYNGTGDMSAGLEFHKSPLIHVRNAVGVLLLFTVAEIMVYLFNGEFQRKRSVVVFFLISMIAFLPYLSYGIDRGHDFTWHFVRIEGLANEIRNGQFPVYMQSLWMGGYGSPVSIFYGDFLLYVPAFLRLAGFSFNASYKMYVLFINALTTLISIYSFRRIFKKEYVAYLLTFVYVCSPYRLVDIYVRFAVGEYSAITFLPLVCAGFYGIVADKAENKDALMLGLGMAGIFCSHSLSTEMTITILVIVCIVLWRRVLTLKCIKKLLLSIAYFALAGMYYIVPFLDSYINNDICIKHITADDPIIIQGYGAMWGQYFSFFQGIFGYLDRLGNRPCFTIGFVLMLSLVAAIVILLFKSGNRKLLFYTFMLLLALFMASDVFPWDYLGRYSVIGHTMVQIQYPWRYLGFSVIFGVLVLGELLTGVEINRLNSVLGNRRDLFTVSAVCALAFIALTEALWFNSSYLTSANRHVYYNTADIDIGERDYDFYMRYGPKFVDLTYGIETENVIINKVDRTGTKTELELKTENTDGYVDLPIFNYKGYHVKDTSGKEYEITDGKNKGIRFTIPAGFDGKMTVKFEVPVLWRVAWVISILFFAGLLINWRYKAIERKKML